MHRRPYTTLMPSPRGTRPFSEAIRIPPPQPPRGRGCVTRVTRNVLDVAFAFRVRVSRVACRVRVVPVGVPVRTDPHVASGETGISVNGPRASPSHGSDSILRRGRTVSTERRREASTTAVEPPAACVSMHHRSGSVCVLRTARNVYRPDVGRRDCGNRPYACLRYGLAPGKARPAEVGGRVLNLQERSVPCLVHRSGSERA